MSLLGLGAKYFTWHDVTFSETAARWGIDNTPDDETQATIVRTAQRADAVREKLGVAMRVSSWFRCLKLNTRIGSKPSSQHVRGEAIDFTAPDFGSADQVFEFLKLHIVELGIDQLIREYPEHANGGWVHISFSDNPRHMAFTITGSK